LALMLLYEIHDIQRFPRVQDFVSYCRLVKCAKQSDGKHYGYAGTKIGNAHLKWAFSEAAVLSLRKNPRAQRYVARLAQKHGKGKAPTLLAHKLARCTTCSGAARPSTSPSSFPRPTPASWPRPPRWRAPAARTLMTQRALPPHAPISKGAAILPLPKRRA
jgi:hypothetical protein